MVYSYSFEECKPILLFTMGRQRQHGRTRIKETVYEDMREDMKKENEKDKRHHGNRRVIALDTQKKKTGMRRRRKVLVNMVYFFNLIKLQRTLTVSWSMMIYDFILSSGTRPTHTQTLSLFRPTRLSLFISVLPPLRFYISFYWLLYHLYSFTEDSHSVDVAGVLLFPCVESSKQW